MTYGHDEAMRDWDKAHDAVCMSRSKFASDALWHEHMVAMDNLAAYIENLEKQRDWLAETLDLSSALQPPTDGWLKAAEEAIRE